MIDVDKVAEAVSKECFDGCEEQGDIRACVDPPCPCRRAARATALEVLRQLEEGLGIADLKQVGELPCFQLINAWVSEMQIARGRTVNWSENDPPIKQAWRLLLRTARAALERTGGGEAT